MSTRTPSQYRSLAPTPRPFPIRGVPGGWRDPWDDDPLDAALAALPRHAVPERSLHVAGEHLGLSARPRDDGRWEAHVVSWDRPSSSSPSPGEPVLVWPSVNGPTASLALDALEAELRELVADVGLTAD